MNITNISMLLLLRDVKEECENERTELSHLPAFFISSA